MTQTNKTEFDAEAYLKSAGTGRRIMQFRKGHALFSQGDPADCVFYLQKGKVKISVVSPRGKEATMRFIGAGDFFGEKAMEEDPGRRVTSATALTACSALSIARDEFIRVMREEPSFSYLFSSFLLASTMRTQANLVDQLFNPAEKRLARLLLMLAESSRPGEDVTLIPQITQETLANMIGSTRPRVNEFMNRFRQMGYIDYDTRIRVHKSLLNVFLRD